MRKNICPCCGSPLLRHASSRGLYWFCTSCGQEMPIVPTPKVYLEKVFSEQMQKIRKKS
jgi:ribosomal protein L37AE/L43A